MHKILITNVCGFLFSQLIRFGDECCKMADAAVNAYKVGLSSVIIGRRNEEFVFDGVDIQ